MEQTNGKLYVITGPSGVGTGEIVERVLAARPELVTVTPVTARKMKKGEENGKGFFFYDLDTWQRMKESGELLETTVLMGNDYGSSRTLVEAELARGYSVVLQLEPDRAAQVKRSMPESVCILVAPLDETELSRRYAASARGSFELPVRMEIARNQCREAAAFCDAMIDSSELERAAAALDTFVGADALGGPCGTD